MHDRDRTQNGGSLTEISPEASGRRDRNNVNSEASGALFRAVKNKSVRSEMYRMHRHKCSQEKKDRRIARRLKQERSGQRCSPRQVPKTIENQRIRDDADIEGADDEIRNEDADDEFALHFNHAMPPRLMITTGRKPSSEMFHFLENLFTVVPNAYYYARRKYHVREIMTLAISRGFTDLLVFNENRKFSKGAKVNGMLHVHLPEGPTCLYRLSSLVLSKKIRNHGRATRHYPELILNNFSTRLGHRIARMFASVFPQKPDFQGRRVVTIHNQRDYIFFRHHRYIFEVREREKPPRYILTSNDLHKTRGVVAANQNERVSEGSEETTRGSVVQQIHSLAGGKQAGLGGHNNKEYEEGGNEDPRLSISPVHARLQELGPRFTLKLISLQKGLFDSRRGEYEYHYSGADGDKFIRRKFVL